MVTGMAQKLDWWTPKVGDVVEAEVNGRASVGQVTSRLEQCDPAGNVTGLKFGVEFVGSFSEPKSLTVDELREAVTTVFKPRLDGSEPLNEVGIP